MNSLPFEQQLTAELNKVEFSKLLIEQSYEYISIFLNRIVPDPTNPRFFPVVIVSDQHAYQIATKKLSKQQIIEQFSAQDKVVFGKSCILNCFKYNSAEWKKVNKTIESITELASNVAVSEIIQVPTLYPLDDGRYQILTGHRRFFAMLYINGIDSAAHFKVYDHRPALPKTKQFQENASREDLPQYGKLQAFKDAMYEIETLSRNKLQAGGKALTVKECASILGISMGGYDNYNVLIRYPAVIDAYRDGVAHPFIRMKKIVLHHESAYRRKKSLSVLNIEHKREINAAIKRSIYQETQVKSKTVAQSYRIPQLQSTNALKFLLSHNVFELPTGIDWQQLDWDNKTQLSEVMELLVSYVEQATSTEKPSS